MKNLQKHDVETFPVWRRGKTGFLWFVAAHPSTMRTSLCRITQQIGRRGYPNILHPCRNSFPLLRLHVPLLRQPRVWRCRFDSIPIAL